MKPRWFQEEAVTGLFDFFDQHRGEDVHPLIALPTGTGKSIIPAVFIQRAIAMYPRTRALLSTHVKPLITQNAGQMLKAWADAPLGIYSAGLRKRDYQSPIVFGGVKSMVNKLNENGQTIFGYRDFMFVDEAHLIGNEGMYIELIKQLKEVNPYLKVIGLSATIYRMGMGLLTNGGIFTHVVYDMCNIEGFDRLMAEGYLSPLISPGNLQTRLDVSGVKIGGDDFNQGALQAAVDKPDVTYHALKETMGYLSGRNCGMIFASGVEHANHISEMLHSTFGVHNVVLHSEMGHAHNDQALADFKAGKVRMAVSMNMLTTGVDHAPIDVIIDLQPTASTGKHVQKYGRGTRPYNYTNAEQYIQGFNYRKHNCLVLDFAGNIERNGPINDPIIPKLKRGKPGDAPVKICSSTNTVAHTGTEEQPCGMYNHTKAVRCFMCNAEFRFQENIDRFASDAEVMAGAIPVIETFKVNHVLLEEHTSKTTGGKSVKVVYYCDNFKTFFDYITVEKSAHPARRHRGKEWFRQHFKHTVPIPNLQPGEDTPSTDKDLLALSREYRWPKALRVWIKPKGQYPEIKGYEF